MSENHFPFVELRSSVKSFRLSAIDLATREASTEGVLTALEQQLKVEDDAECRILLGQAIEATRARLSGRSWDVGKKQKSASPDDLEAYVTLSPTERFRILSQLSERQRDARLSRAPDLLRQETYPLASARLIQIFGPLFPEDQLSELISRVASPHLAVRLASLDVVIRRAPERLKPVLAELLTAPDPGIRSRAVRVLTYIDRELAVEQLRRLLISSDRSLRIAGLQNCLYLPFSEVQSLLISYLAVETDGDLIERAGLLFAINPDPRLPFQLGELMVHAPSDKAHILRKILNVSCQLLEDSQLLGDQYPEFRRKLKTWISNKTASRCVQQCLDHLPPPPDGWAPEHLVPIQKALENPCIRETFEKAIEWPISEHARLRIQELLKGTSSTDSLTALQVPAPPPSDVRNPHDDEQPASGTDHTRFSFEEQLRILSLCEAKDKATVSPLIAFVLLSKDAPPSLRATAFRAAIRLSESQYLDSAEAALKHTDPLLVSAVLEYLACFAVERILPTLGRFLQHTEHRLRSTAVQILKRVDIHQALSSVQLLLQSRDEDKRVTALSCLISFDFSLVRDLLEDFLRTCTSRQHMEQALCLFQVNPDPENLYSLYRLSKQVSEDKKREIQIATEFIKGAITDSGMMDSEQLGKFIGTFEVRYARHQARSGTKDESVQPISPENPSPWVEWLNRQMSGKTGRQVKIGILAFALLVVSVFVFSRMNGTPAWEPLSAPIEVTGITAKWVAADVKVKQVFAAEKRVMVKTREGQCALLQSQHRVDHLSPGQAVRFQGTIQGLIPTGELCIQALQIQTIP